MFLSKLILYFPVNEISFFSPLEQTFLKIYATYDVAPLQRMILEQWGGVKELRFRFLFLNFGKCSARVHRERYYMIISEKEPRNTINCIKCNY